ncbi:MAG TPA: hypothetical protein VF763_07905 [Candidatus Limnocylindrales bacterium]
MADDPRGWRPQRFGTRNFRHIKDALIEPFWEGVRVLVHLEPGGDLAILDESGEDYAGEYPDVDAAIRAAADAGDGLVLDGYLTRQATRSGAGTAIVAAEAPTPTESLARLVVGGAARQEVKPPEIDPDRQPVAFVAVDLLLVDGESLLDVPLLERKRLLEGVLAESTLARRSPYVRPPVDTWLVSWRSNGFRQLAYKSANARYHPGEASDDWTTAAMPAT